MEENRKEKGMRLLLVFTSILLLTSVAKAACPTQPATLIAANGKLSICSDEAITAVRIERNGVVQTPDIPITLVAGVPKDLSGLVMCSTGTLKAAGVNAAGVSPWGAPVSATFPGCVAPVWGPALP